MAAARALLLFALLIVAPDTATAQFQDVITPQVVTPRTPPPSRIRAAPDVVLPTAPSPALRPIQALTIRPSIVFSEEYTDNFDRTEDNRISNLRSTLGPRLFALIDQGFFTGQAGYTLSVHHDTAEGEGIGYSHSFVSRLSWEATPRLRLNAGYVLSQTDEPAEADRLNLRQERRQFTTNAVSVDAIYRLGTVEVRPHYRLSHFSESDQTTISHTLGVDSSLAIDAIHALTAGYNYLRSETSDDASGTAPGQSGSSKLTGHEITASVMRDLTARSTAGLSGAFAARQQTSPVRDSDFTRWNLSVFNNYSLPERLEMRLSIGVSQLIGDLSTGKPLLTTLSSLSYWFGPAVATLIAERGFAETFGEGQNFGVVATTGVSASLTYPFTPLVSGLLRVSYRENTFTGEGEPDIDSSAGSGRGRDETTLSGTASVSVQLLRWLGSSLDYLYTDLTSSDRSRRYTENRVRLRLHASF